MNLSFLGLQEQNHLINGVKLFPLKVNRDSRGLLVETLKETWADVYGKDLPFCQTYYSITNPLVARDEDLWHCHPTKQVDRFVFIKGSAVLALFDKRENSMTKNHLNLFLMGEENSDNNQFLLLIPKMVYHGFLCVSKDPCYLLNYPTTSYDKSEEGRIPIAESGALFEDGSPFSWKLIRNNFIK